MRGLNLLPVSMVADVSQITQRLNYFNQHIWENVCLWSLLKASSRSASCGPQNLRSRPTISAVAWRETSQMNPSTWVRGQVFDLWRGGWGSNSTSPGSTMTATSFCLTMDLFFGIGQMKAHSANPIETNTDKSS